MIFKVNSGDRQRADLISQALQDYFNQNPGCAELRSTDAYEILAKKNVFEKDRHEGIKFRAFLKHLKNNNALNLIPQCRWEQSGAFTNWFFSTAMSQTVKGRNLVPLAQLTKENRINPGDYAEKVNGYSKRNTGELTKLQLTTRQDYSRAYEIWTVEELKDLKDLFEEMTDVHQLSKIFKRQPSAIKARLIKMELIK